MRQKIKNFLSLLKNNSGLWPVLAVFLSLASWRFVKQGIVNFDEAYFTVVVRTFSTIAKTAILHPTALLSGGFFSALAENHGNVYTAARPSYIIFSSFLALFVSPEIAPRLVSLLAGLLALVFFYRLLGLYGLDKKSRAILTLLPALSPLFLVYSRLGLSQMFSAAWLMASTFYLLRFYQAGAKSDLKKFSLALAIMFLSHYNVMFLVFWLLVYGGWALKKHRGRIKDWFDYIAYFLALPLAWEIITRLGSAVAGNRLGEGQKVLAYSQEFFNQLLKAQVSEEKPFHQLFYYPNLMILTEGIFVFIFFLAGLFIFLRKIKKIEYQAILVTLIFSLLVFTAGQLKFPRSLLSLLPLIYLVAAIGLYGLAALLAKRKYFKLIWVVPIFCLLAIVPHVWRYGDYLEIETGSAQAANFIRTNYDPKDTLIVSWSAAVWRAYLPGYRSEQLAEPEKWRQELQTRKNLLIIHDYFSDILGQEGVYDVSGRPVFSLDTRIFSAQPVIMDFIYKPPAIIKKVFSDNPASQIVIYQNNE